MKTIRRALCALLFLLFIFLLGAALAEPARVVTPGGKLNVRRNPKETSTILYTVPNKALVEVDAIEGDWARITYKKRSGYVHTTYLRLTSALVGMQVYTDGASLVLRAEPREDSTPLCPLSPCQAVAVLQVQSDWMLAQLGEVQGWLPTASFTYQYTAPAAQPDWLDEPGQITHACDALVLPKAGAAVSFSLQEGEAVVATLTADSYCLVQFEDGCGYVPQSCVALTGVVQTDDTLSADERLQITVKARACLSKAYKTFGEEKTRAEITLLPQRNGIAGPLWQVCFFTGEGQYRYCVLLGREDSTALYTARYKGFSLPSVPEERAFSPGEMVLTASADSLAIGDVIDFTVSGWTHHLCTYTLLRGGSTLVQSEPGSHFTASFRAREAGDYVLRVTVQDEEGLSATAEQAFTVRDAQAEDNGLSLLYSQQDGWWADKAYRNRNLQKSGCAIFALSHALQRMHILSDAVRPENLAVTFRLCLVQGGTNNERLLREAGQLFGFTTRTSLMRDESKILSLLEGGTLFSFSVVNGHIAMTDGLTDDGLMLHIVDSAPSATFERIKNAYMYTMLPNGQYREIASLEEVAGSRWYFETDRYGGLEYYLPFTYVAKRGVRPLIVESAGTQAQ